MNFNHYGYGSNEIIQENAINFCNDNTIEAQWIQKTWQLMQKAESDIILPNIGTIRTQSINTKNLKLGSDFFTIIDTQVEELLSHGLSTEFDEDVTIIGEEFYTGQEVQSKYSVRIDPIDGTIPMKYGSSSRSIMAGLYEHTNTNQKQIAGLVYFPEIEGKPLIIRYQKKLRISNTRDNTSIVVGPIQQSNTIYDSIVDIRANTNRTNTIIDTIISTIRGTGINIRGSLIELEGLLMRGKRIEIIDQGPGGYECRDFIPYSFLQLVGYSIYNRNGILVDADDPSIANQGLICIPPGKIGKKIKDIIIKITQPT